VQLQLTARILPSTALEAGPATGFQVAFRTTLGTVPGTVPEVTPGSVVYLRLAC